MAVERSIPIEDSRQDVEEELEFGPQVQMLEDGSAEVTVDEAPEEAPIEAGAFGDNLVPFIQDEALLQEIADAVLDDTDKDKQTRKEWEDTLKKGLKLTGIHLEEGSEPFEGASTCVHPLIIEAAVKYQSKSIQEIFQPGGPCRSVILGNITQEKEQQAKRVKDFINYQLLQVIDDYYTQTERQLIKTAQAGISFDKVMPNPFTREPEIESIPIDNFIINDNSTSLRKARGYTHIYYLTKSELRQRQINGFYVDEELGEPSIPDKDGVEKEAKEQKGFTDDGGAKDAEYEIYERHCGLALPLEVESNFVDDDVELPYVIHVEKSTKKVLGIYRNWKEGDPRHEKIVWFVDRHFIPSIGFHSLGLIHIFGNSAMALTFALRALIDAGQFANLPAGLKAKGMRITGGDKPFAPGEWREAEALNMDITKALVPLPYKEPSATLFSLMQWFDGRIQKFADSTENVIADSTNLGPVGTTLALLEASAKFEASLHKRNHQAQKKTYELIAFVDGEYLIDEEYPYDVEGETRVVRKTDFDARIDIVPISDPNAPSGTHRMAVAMQQVDLALKQPQIHNMQEVFRRFYNAAGVQEVDKILPQPPQAKPLDPVSDIAMAVKGMPIGAFPGQDHRSHIAVEMAWIKDPSNGSSPIMAGPLSAVQSHVRDHMMQLIKDQMQVMGAADPAAQAAVAQEIMKVGAGQDALMDIEWANVRLQERELDQQAERTQLEGMGKVAELALKNKDLQLRAKDIALRGVQGGKKVEAEKESQDKDIISDLIKELIQQVGETKRARIRNKEVDKPSKKD